jgi:hypothetical protein
VVDEPLAPGRLWRGKDEAHGYLRLAMPGLVTIDGKPQAAWTAVRVPGPRDSRWQIDPHGNQVCIRIADLDEYFEPCTLCDFCGAENPTWHYPSEGGDYRAEAIMADLSVRGMTIHDAPGWGACEECAELIDANDAEGLARRTVESFANVTGDPEQDAEIMDSLRAISIEYHRTAFFDVRRGDRSRIDTG